MIYKNEKYKRKKKEEKLTYTKGRKQL